jgi:flagellar biosynthesis protein FlhF
MEIKTFRAKTMPQALDLVRRELGPEAMVLHTRELNAGLLGRLLGNRAYEIAATPYPPPSQGGARGGIQDAYLTYHLEPAHVQDNVPVPSPSWRGEEVQNHLAASSTSPLTPTHQAERNEQSLHSLSSIPQSAIPKRQSSTQLAELQSLLEQLRARSARKSERDIPPALFDLFTDLIDADVDEDSARDLLDRLRREPSVDLHDKHAMREQLACLLESELRVAGPIRIVGGAGRVVALVGPTGVGKTTTIAKLAANYRLRENRRVGLITVDTYRIAAVEQLRTYAEIIDLPMEVVSTPREMRAAVQKMRDFDLVLMDTAGRSPRDEVRIRELRAMLAEAEPQDVHLVLSAAASARSLAAAAEKFSPVGVTSLIITKLDEATGLGNLFSLARGCRLPFSYLTDGQNVPDDIAVAEAHSLAQLILNHNSI